MAINLRVPYFARGTYEKLVASLEEGGIFEHLDRVVWTVLTDDEHKGMLAFVSPEKQITLMKGDNPKQVKTVEALPDIQDADPDTLYILDNIVYVYNADSQTYHPSYEPVSIEIANVSDRVSVLENKSDGYDTEIQNVNQEIQDLGTQVTNINSIVDSHTLSLQDLETNLSNLTTQFDAASIDISNLFTKTTELENDKADKATTLAGYGITDSYTKDEISNIVGNVGSGSIEDFVNDSISNAMELNIV